MRNLRFNNYLHHVFNNNELNKFFIAITIRMFAVNLIVFFVPAVMWQRGLDLGDIALFFLIWSLSHALMAFTAARFVQRFHAKTMFYIAMPLYVLYILLIGSITESSLIPIAVLAGASNSIFWLSYHLYFSARTDGKTRGRKISSLQFLTGVVMMIAPLIGGFFLENMGYYWLIAIMAVLLAASVIPLSEIKHARIKKLSAKDVAHVLASKNGLAYVARGSAGGPVWVVWPLLLFLLLEGFLNLGLVTFATSLISLVIMLWLGAIIDRVKYRKALNITSFLEAAVNVAKVFVFVPFVAVIIDVLEKLIIKSYFMVFDARSYELGRDPQHIVAREIGINFGCVIVFFVIFLFPSFAFAFVLAALGALWSMIL